MFDVTLDDILHMMNILAPTKGKEFKLSIEAYNVLLEQANYDYLNYRYFKWEKSRDESDDLKFLKDVNESETITAGLWSLPYDFYRLSSVLVDTTGTPTYCDVITDMELAERLIDSLTAPSATYPVCTVDNENIRFYPSTITSADITYLRYPDTPVYAQKLSNGIYVYDTSNCVEFEWPDNCAADIIRLMLGYLGIVIDKEIIAEQVNEINR